MFVFLQKEPGLTNVQPGKLNIKTSEFITAKYFHNMRGNPAGHFNQKEYELFIFFSDHMYLKLVLKNSL